MQTQERAHCVRSVFPFFKKERKKKKIHQLINVLYLIIIPDKCVNTPSIGETKAVGLFESNPDDFVKFTERHVTKIYPHGTRTGSSNLKPYPFWGVGCQIGMITDTDILYIMVI